MKIATLTSSYQLEKWNPESWRGRIRNCISIPLSDLEDLFTDFHEKARAFIKSLLFHLLQESSQRDGPSLSCKTIASGLRDVCGYFTSGQGSSLKFTMNNAGTLTICQMEIRICQSPKLSWGEAKHYWLTSETETISKMALSLWKDSSGQSLVVPQHS